jgi:16S rRNA (cytosine967-C5)-methyltransferase
MSGDARKTALYVLNALDRGRQTLDSIMDHVPDGRVQLSKRDRSLFFALVYGVVRWRGQLDWIIDRFSTTRRNKIDPGILNILRIGLFQIIHLDRVPASAAVHSSVEMAKSVASSWVVRYVNALLRKAAKEYKNLSYPDLSQDPVPSLSIRKSFPAWIVARWLDRFGTKETEKLCDAVNAIPAITVRTNTLLTTRQALMARLQNTVENIRPTRYTAEGICFTAPKTAIPELGAFKDGWFQVQDEAAQLVTYMLDPQPDETVLDACAGLGGKTGHIAQNMKNRGRILAVDKDEEKLGRLMCEMQRMKISAVRSHPYDWFRSADEMRPGMFDRVLLDAPCSGLGVIRRNPDIKWSVSPEQLITHRQRQRVFLDSLARLVRPSGVLVYAVCSTEPEETDEVTADFLKRHPGFAVDRGAGPVSEMAFPPVIREGYLKTFPHLHGMDGFFSVRFKRMKR